MDRYDEKAREIWPMHPGGAQLEYERRMIAATLRAAAEMGKAGETGKPVAREWRNRPRLCTMDGECRTVSEDADWYAARAYGDGQWSVWRSKNQRIASGRDGGRDAADAWIRAHADELPFGLPDEPARPTAPQPTATVEEVLAGVVVDGYRLDGRINRVVNTNRLRRALSALSPEQRAVMVAAIKETP